LSGAKVERKYQPTERNGAKGKAKVLITGGAGFIGSNLADALLRLGWEVIIVDNLSTGRLENVPDRVNFYQVDIVNPKLKSIFAKEKPNVVWHLASLTDTSVSEESIRQDIEINLIGTLNTLTAASQVNAQKFIFSSTAAVYGNTKSLPIPEITTPNPISPYGIGKLTCENYIRIYCEFCRMKYTILRYGNVYGPRQYPKGESGAIPIFIDQMLSGRTPALYGNGNQIRDYINVEDVVAASIQAIRKADGKTINIGTAQGTSTRQLYAMIAQELEFNAPPKTTNPRVGEIVKSILDNSLAKKELNWRPKTHLATGIVKTINWWKEKNW
jgi:UDP-glucose 4-epimerase